MRLILEIYGILNSFFCWLEYHLTHLGQVFIIWLIVNAILMTKLQWKQNQNTLILIQQNEIESVVCKMSMMMSSNGNIFRVTGPLCGEFTGDRGIPLTKAIDGELWCFLWSGTEQTNEWIIETSVIWDAIAFMMTSLQCRPLCAGLNMIISCAFFVV